MSVPASVSMASFAQEFITSGIFIGLVLVLRYVLISMTRRNAEILSKEQRRWITRIKNGTFVVVFIGLSMVWAPQLQTFALSLTAFAVALVVATKEMILCLTGSLLRVSTQTYKVGDWVTIDGITGEVMDIDAFSTRVEEIDAKTYNFTGKKVSIPNSKLFTSQVENRNFIKNYMFHDLSLTVQYPGINPAALFETFQQIIKDHLDPHQEDAGKFTRRVARKAGVDFQYMEPSVGLRTSDVGHYVFTARIFIPTRDSDKIIPAITKEFLDFANNMRNIVNASPQQTGTRNTQATLETD
jgi:small-conductance mechanosensitive channel